MIGKKDLRGGEVFEVRPIAERQPRIATLAQYEEIYARSLAEPAAFWGDRAQELVSWKQGWHSVQLEGETALASKWFVGAQLNVSYNCLDRHIDAGKGDKKALLWQGESDDDRISYTYNELLAAVCRCALMLRRHGVERGDRVAIYLPMIPELAITMLACTRIGAVHSVIFAGFSSSSLGQRIEDCGAKVVVTADAVLRAGKTIPLKTGVDEALLDCPTVDSCLVVCRAGLEVSLQPGRDYLWDDELAATPQQFCPAVAMASDEPLFILYTSGSTGTPKGVVHSTGGYFTYVLHTTQWVFDFQEDDICWCTADIGWITGHSYALYGPLGLGGTTLLFEGVPSYPDHRRFWQIIDRYGVSIFYTAPTVIRALMAHGEEPVLSSDLSSLRILGSVGEPINPEAWLWYFNVVGKGKLPIVDTWWQTETGGIMVAPLPYITPLKPGAASLPLPGVDIVLRSDGGEQCNDGEPGSLHIRQPWPGMLSGLFADDVRFRETYFPLGSGEYLAGDGACYDSDGYLWILGRLDDVINVSGHRLGTAEIESALTSHYAVSEAAVVAKPHPVKGEAIYAFVSLFAHVERSEELVAELRKQVREVIGPIASPDAIQCAGALPKTRSGKILRRILRKIAAGEEDNFGDTSTLADPTVVLTLLAGRKDAVG